METSARERRILRGVSWEEFERRLAAKHDKRVPLMAYLDGVLELMSPRLDHEWMTRQIEQLLATYALEHGIEFSTLGSSTLRKKIASAGIEPDNCYFFGPAWRGRRRPDLAIEVQWTRGGIKKLEINIAIHSLHQREYTVVENSRFVPGIDLPHLCTFIDRPTTSRAILEYRAALRATTPPSAG